MTKKTKIPNSEKKTSRVNKPAKSKAIEPEILDAKTDLEQDPKSQLVSSELLDDAPSEPLFGEEDISGGKILKEPQFEGEDLDPLSDTSAPYLTGSKVSAGITRSSSATETSEKQNLPTVASGNYLTTQDPLTQYLAEIRNYKLLTPEEERALAIKYKEEGDTKAAEKLVTSNLRFVVKIAAEYSKFGAKMIDLIQEGNVGLMHAVKEFNPHKGVRLITYAVWWIRGYIREYLMRQYSMVRLGTTHNQKKLFYNLQQEERKLEALGQEIDLESLSLKLGIPKEEIEDMKRRLKFRDLSLDQPIDDESKSSLLDYQTSATDISPEDMMVQNEEIQILRDNLEKIKPELNSKELYILENRLMTDEPRTLQEIGDHMGITRERARQIEARLMEKIKATFIEKEA